MDARLLFQELWLIQAGGSFCRILFSQKNTTHLERPAPRLLKGEIEESIGEKSHFETGIKLATITATNSYQYSFSPNWICREVVAVEVITPAVGDGPPVADVNTTGFGVLKFV